VQKAQRDQKRAIDAYNREARRYNAGVKKAVNDYKRDVRTYNTKARDTIARLKTSDVVFGRKSHG